MLADGLPLTARRTPLLAMIPSGSFRRFDFLPATRPDKRYSAPYGGKFRAQMVLDRKWLRLCSPGEYRYVQGIRVGAVYLEGPLPDEPVLEDLEVGDLARPGALELGYDPCYGLVGPGHAGG